MTKTKSIRENIDLKFKDTALKDTQLFLAPMAGYTDLPFRLLAKEMGADTTVSEMISAKGLYYGDKKTRSLLRSVPEESPYGIQIFGSEPKILAKAVNILEDLRDKGEVNFEFIDFNIGCPAPKIVKNGDGSALLNDLDLLYDCIVSLNDSTDLPISVKTRMGFKENKIEDIIPVIDRTETDFITIHPRTREQFYSGRSDWEAVRTAKELTDKPIVLSGDITSPEAARQALETGADALMIGRAAIEDPLIFEKIRSYFSTGTYSETTPEDRIKTALRHLELAQEHSDNPNVVIPLRKQLAAYTKGLPNASKARGEIFKAKSPEEIVQIFQAAQL